MMNIIINISIAILPAILIILGCFYCIKEFRTIPLKHRILLFGFGVLISLPLYGIEKVATESTLFELSNWRDLLVYSFIMVAFFEELLKYIIAIIYPYKHRIFKSNLQLIISIALIGLGFATIENVIYAILFDIQTMITRTFTAIPLHLSLSIIMGYFFGIAKKEGQKRSFSIAMALFLPLILHGLYDLFIIQNINDNLKGISLLVLIICCGLSIKLFIMVGKSKFTLVELEPGNMVIIPNIEIPSDAGTSIEPDKDESEYDFF